MAPIEQEVQFGQIGEEETTFRVRCKSRHLGKIKDGLRSLQSVDDNAQVDLTPSGTRAVGNKIGGHFMLEDGPVTFGTSVGAELAARRMLLYSNR